MGPAGDEGHVVAGLDEAGPDEAADSAGTHHQDAHAVLVSVGRLGSGVHGYQRLGHGAAAFTVHANLGREDAPHIGVRGARWR